MRSVVPAGVRYRPFGSTLTPAGLTRAYSVNPGG